MKIPSSLKMSALRASTLLPPAFRVIGMTGPSLVTQMVSYRDHYPVKTYKSIADLSVDLAKLRWTEDPWDGKLDTLWHPTFMAEALERHPDFCGDCASFAAYSCVAILKSKLAQEVYFASAQWIDPKVDDLDGHAVCVYRDDSGWHWIGNWNNGQPYNCVRDGWVDQMDQSVRSSLNTSIVVAQQWEAVRESHDSLLFGQNRVLRR